MAEYTLHCFAQSGNAYKPALMLALCGADWEARFVDFLQENIASHADADIGAAVRVVHEGCRKVLKQHLELEPVRPESEGSRITLPQGFDASSVRVSGHIVGAPPFTGTLIHRGWRVSRITLPKLSESHDARVLAPAEVEL